MQFRFDDQLIDTDRRELRRGGSLMALEPQVFDLLVYLVQNRDRVVTKEYGQAYAAAIPNAKFETVTAAGHLPWLEQPVETFRLVDAFVAATPAHP